jgi:hypothetical protein
MKWAVAGGQQQVMGEGRYNRGSVNEIFGLHDPAWFRFVFASTLAFALIKPLRFASRDSGFDRGRP